LKSILLVPIVRSPWTTTVHTVVPR